MKVIAGPQVEPVSLVEVKAQIGISETDTVSDALISRRIVEAREYVEGYCKRPLITQTQEIRWDGFLIEMELPAAITVVSVKYVDNDGVLQTVDPSLYVLDTYGDIPFLHTAYALVWPIPRNERNAVRVQFTAGYGPTPSTVPTQVKEAMILLVGHMMNNQRQSESGVITYRVPGAIDEKLDQYVISRYIP
jgi:uncharacterized phiE125 gp8 family phage protein